MSWPTGVDAWRYLNPLPREATVTFARRVDPFEAIDARLRHLIQAMRECTTCEAMAKLMAERDKLLDQRIVLERTIHAGRVA